MELASANAKMELAVLNAQSKEFSKIDVITELTNRGLPQEGVTRMEALWDYTKMIAGQVFNVGRIIAVEILNFIRENHNMAIGMVIGAGVGALTSLVPYLGPILSPVSIAVGAVGGAIIGSQLDSGKSANGEAFAVGEQLIVMAKKFFGLLAAIFNALMDEFSDRKEVQNIAFA